MDLSLHEKTGSSVCVWEPVYLRAQTGLTRHWVRLLGIHLGETNCRHVLLLFEDWSQCTRCCGSCQVDCPVCGCAPKLCRHAQNESARQLWRGSLRLPAVCASRRSAVWTNATLWSCPLECSDCDHGETLYQRRRLRGVVTEPAEKGRWGDVLWHGRLRLVRGRTVERVGKPVCSGDVV